MPVSIVAYERLAMCKASTRVGAAVFCVAVMLVVAYERSAMCKASIGVGAAVN